MSYCRQVTASLFSHAVVTAILLLAFFSCRIPKGQQKGKPFVYKTNIQVLGNFSNNDRQDLALRLSNQLDDSLQVKTVTAADWPWKTFPFIYKKLVNPPAFDSGSIDRSIVFMRALLKANGYYEPQITDSVKIKTVKSGKKKQERVTVDFLVRPGKRLVFDSISFDLSTPALQQLAAASGSQSLLKKGEPYSKQILSLEINRLVDTFRNNGYYRFSREDLYMEHDTVEAALIDPSLDPFQQAELLEKLKNRRNNPTINVSVKQRQVRDQSHLTKYYLGSVTVYPDLPTTEDTGYVKTDTTIIRNIGFITRSNKFKLPFIANNVFLRPGKLYKQENYFKTTNRFTQLTAWQSNNIDLENSENSDSLLDVTINMYPAKKQKLNADLEASRNSYDIVTASNLFGLGVNFGLQNRNAYRQSVQTNTNLRGGVELGANFIQTTQASISHTITFPQAIPIFIKPNFFKSYNKQTLLNLNASYTDRRKFFTDRTVDGSWGYQYSKSRLSNVGEKQVSSSKTFLIKIPNIEYTTLDKTDSFNNVLASNPSLSLAFRTGLVIGEQFLYNSIRTKGNKTNSFFASADESGALLGLNRKWDEGELLRFIKGEIEFRHNIDYGKNQLVFRVYAGAGLAYGRQDTSFNGIKNSRFEQTLPFYKAFFSGGPNSMRAWQVRQLGLGSSKYYDDSSRSAIDRFGDIKLEGNIEYRFLLGTFFGIKFRSALYTDIGNVWSRKPIDTSAAAIGSDFQINRFYKEFAVGMGTGLRLDFNYFIIRFDWAYEIRDPQRKDDADKWFYNLKLRDGQFQLGINYPF